MNAIKIGNVDIEEVPGAILRQKRGQAATLTRPYKGTVDDLPAFIAANQILTTDYQFPSMVLDGLEATWDGPEGGAMLTYVGLPAGNASNPGGLQSDANYVPASVVLYTDNTADGLWIANYYSPTVTYRYAISAKLSDPQYQGYSESPSNITIRDSQSVSPNLLSPGYTMQGKFQYQVFSVCSDFSRRQKGTIYDYSETWNVLVQQPGKNSILTLDVGGISVPQDI